MKKNIKVFKLISIIAIFSIIISFFTIDSFAARIGNNYEQQMPVPGVKAPSVRIKTLSSINPGESVDLTANETVDEKNGASSFFYWYADRGSFEVNPAYPDYSTVTYTAPAASDTVNISVRVGDTLGYVAKDTVSITVGDGATVDPGDLTPVNEDCTYTVTPSDWQQVYHTEYLLTAERTATNKSIGHFRIQPEFDNQLWDYSGHVQVIINGSPVTLYEDSELQIVHGPSYGYHPGGQGFEIWFDADFSSHKSITLHQSEDSAFGGWDTVWMMKAKCPVSVKNGTPDLTVKNAEAEPLRMAPGEVVNTRVRISNIGDASANASTLGCYLSVNGSTWDSSDILMYQEKVKTIIDGRNAYVETDVTIPENFDSGDYYLIFRADDEGIINEENTDNNEANVRIEVRDGADLTVSHTDIVKANVTPGKSVTLSARVTNSGGTGTLAASRLGYYLSLDEEWDSSDTLLGTNYFGSLLPAQSESFTRTFTIPASLPFGHHYIIFYADYDKNVSETNTDNNRVPVSIQVNYSKEMTVFIPNAQTSWSAGRDQTIEWTSNLGGTVKIELYKSLTRKIVISNSAPNNGSFIWKIAADLTPDTNYWIKIISNADTSISDDSERFAITYPQTLTLMTPGNNDIWGYGTTRNITWSSSFKGIVDIDLYKAGSFYRTVDRAVETTSVSDNTYAWIIPSDIPEGADYQISVTHSSDRSTFDMNDGYFSIADPNANNDPVAIDDSATTEQETAVIISVLANDNPIDGETLKISAITQGENGTVVINGDNTITYTPASGFAGSDYFTYTVISTGNGVKTATVYITVSEGIVICDTWELPPGAGTLAKDEAGNVYAVGGFRDSITLGNDSPVTLTADGLSAIYIAKYSPSGSLIWAQKATAEYGEIAPNIAVDKTGNLYISGYYQYTMNIYNGDAVFKTLSEEGIGGYEVFIAKYNPLGQPVWAEMAGGQWDDFGESLMVDSASGYLYIGGSFDGILNLGSGASATTLNSADDNVDMFLAKYTLNGTLVWAKNVAGGTASIFSIASDGADGVLATGYYEENVTFSGASPVTLTGTRSRQFFIAEFSADNGQAKWAQKANGYNSIGRDVAVDDTGNIYVTGTFNQTCDFYNGNTVFKTLNNYQDRDEMFMIKYNANGTPEWIRQAGGSSYDSGEAITFDGNKNPVFIGSFYQYPAEFTKDASGQTIVSNTSGIATYDANGNFQGFMEPGTGMLIAETSGNPAIIGKDGVVSPCGTISVNNPPVVVDDTANTIEEQPVTINVLDNDSDPDGDTLSVTNVTQGANGGVMIDTGGLTVTYTPNAGFMGTDTFEYTVSDGNGGVSTASVSILVESGASALSVTDIQPSDTGAVTVNQVFTFTLNEPVTAGTCYSSISLEDSNGTSVSINTVINGNGLTIEPATTLASGMDYILTIPVCALEGATGGNALSEDILHAFTTESGSTSVIFTDITAGNDHTVALDSDGNVWAWGGNNYGQVGDGSVEDRLTPVQVQGVSNITEIAAGAWHTLALDIYGSVWAWGYNPDGQLGNGTQINSSVPVNVSGLTDIIAIATGNSHSIALKGDGTVWTWGKNSSYQLGHGLGDTTDELIPGQVPNLFNVIDIAGGYNFTTVLKQDRTVWSWGRNDRGQLGTGDIIDRKVPAQALLAANADSIYGTLGTRAFAIMTDGTVWGWGYNGMNGAVGNGSGWDQPFPVKVLDNATDLSGGEWHTIALTSDGTIKAWGRNDEGEYGNGTTNYSSTPVPGADISNVINIEAGRVFTVALKENGTIWCWGYNGKGQLGNNTTENALIPVQVIIK
ncbi:Cell adhesion related domain (CARDB)-containing protein, immunoglobulin-like fold-containing [Desulfonema limicola]|uniref:Cell adhesion related domain (CARDB)-containing protein, immunoglobulin-like fold-containing n=1 Tax=Desulfonema limicola TaxID=45656 RepID=A0A975GF19_9BACT|nr:Ig-like domain-containing protein [Desulfonema limicola]QTA78778.1 Cell adhesion related domain (CARDB)-containing protein, immunoglobulin-like fold-containing [Desulfonema limicola]